MKIDCIRLKFVREHITQDDLNRVKKETAQALVDLRTGSKGVTGIGEEVAVGDVRDYLVSTPASTPAHEHITHAFVGGASD